jgi:hypothetical protein
MTGRRVLGWWLPVSWCVPEVAQWRLPNGAQLGSLAAIWLPYTIWKLLGISKIQKVSKSRTQLAILKRTQTIKTFNLNDGGKGSLQVLKWRLVSHSNFTSKAVLVIELPVAQHHITTFHPQAYPDPRNFFAPPAYPPASNGHRAPEEKRRSQPRENHDAVAESMFARR